MNVATPSRWVASIAAVIGLSGCATFASLTGLNRVNLGNPPYPPTCQSDFEYVFSGIRLDRCVVEYGEQNPQDPYGGAYFFYGLVDMPFSLIGDTVLLPVTLTLEAID